MDDQAAKNFQRIAVRTMLLKVAKYSLIACGIAYFTGSAWWLLLMVPGLPLAILRTNAQVGTGSYLSERGKYLNAKRECKPTGDQGVVGVDAADNLEEYISQVDCIIDFWGSKELVLTTQVGSENITQKCALFCGEGFDKRIKPMFIALTIIDAAKKFNMKGPNFAFEFFDSMRENMGDLK